MFAPDGGGAKVLLLEEEGLPSVCCGVVNANGGLGSARCWAWAPVDARARRRRCAARALVMMEGDLSSQAPLFSSPPRGDRGVGGCVRTAADSLVAWYCVCRMLCARGSKELLFSLLAEMRRSEREKMQKREAA